MRQVHSWRFVRLGLVIATVALGLVTAQFTVARPSASASTPPCQTSCIHLSREGVSGAGGTDVVPFIIRYDGNGACKLSGYATLQFYGVTDAPIKLSVYKKNLSYFRYRSPSTVTLSRSHPATFGIEITQNLNQNDHATACIGSTAHVALPLLSKSLKASFTMKWATGKVSWNYAIDWCFSGWRYGETPIESGSSPAHA